MVELEGLMVATTLIISGGGLYVKLKSRKKHEEVSKKCEEEIKKLEIRDVENKLTHKSQVKVEDEPNQTYYINGIKTNCKNLVVSTNRGSVGYTYSTSETYIKPKLIVIKGSKNGYNSKPLVKALYGLKSA